MTKNITILGSTGSIGESTLRVIKSLGDEFSVYGIACKKNIDLLDKQIEEFQPSIVAVESIDSIAPDEYKTIKKKYPEVEFFEGESGVIELAKQNVDILVSAIVGAAGLKPTLEALNSSKRIAIANKETLVMAGDLFMEMLKSSGSELIPVDSEHSAIFSLMDNLDSSVVERIIITASGGSLKNFPIEDLPIATPEDALSHPTWNMGNKITIDSATLMNKGLEVIEAHYLFNIEYDKISIVIHPESIIHSMIETIDSNIYAHLSVTDMALPILSALKYPEKIKNSFGHLNLEEIGSLNFLPFNKERYPAFDLCCSAGKTGGTMPAVLNASNEIAVDAFLNKKILFTDIIKVVENTMKHHKVISNPGLNDIFDADIEAREIANSFVEKGEK